MTRLPDGQPRLRVCVIARAHPFIWVHHYVKAFRGCCEVITAGPALTPEDLVAMERTHLSHLVIPNDIDCEIDTIETLIARLPAGWKPDLIVTIQSGLKPIQNLEWLNCPTAYISIDSWHDFAELTFARPYDFVFCAQREFVQHFTDTGSSRVYWLPLACDPDEHHPEACAKDADFTFVGSTQRTLHGERTRRLDRLAERHRVLLGTGMTGDEMSRTCARGHIAFNSSVAQDVNMRVFEIMAMGLPLLTNRNAEVNGLLDLFEDDVHLITYDDEDLLTRAARYLGDDVARDRMGDAARAHVLAHHTYRHRVEQLLEVVGKHVEWPIVRQRSTTRGHGALNDYLPVAPGQMADYGMNAGVSKYAVRRSGATALVGLAFSTAQAESRRGSYDRVLSLDTEWVTGEQFDSLLLIASEEMPFTVEHLARAHTLLRPGGTLVAGIRQVDWEAFGPATTPESAWVMIDHAGFAVLRMELKELRFPDDVCAYFVARKMARSMRDVARAIYSRNPMPGISLDELLCRME